MAILRELTCRYDGLKEDICMGASSGNSGILCTGKSDMMLLREGEVTFECSCEDGIVRSGAMVIAWKDEERELLPKLLQDNLDIGDTGARILSAEELYERESRIRRGAKVCFRMLYLQVMMVKIYGNIVCGPTAEDVDERDEPTTCSTTIANLVKYARQLVPSLQDMDVAGSYAGLRPATEFRDYQIKGSEDENWITVAGIRSTGVSASLGIGQYVVSLLKRMRQAPPALKRDRSLQPKNIKSSFLSVLRTAMTTPQGSAFTKRAYLQQVVHT
ncbi:hypothetical protein GUITHDRAFT_115662 [Guillardia theta CCMP2712]|uniref:FAD dependent oxidoreductase domain-containing protein n=1 Tax=Guillardia theta (strain CCMP2712) TaxID=905079 RepID=L1IPB7_GUITC|nr:hypothetical protein GUITHDRAFT_115662 [Guillardia theta CCMP2712]EKX38108.1 hypothetical protein GUITHDRAFT_115662 [Guillardia theta CCMP2712]|eukprot:XP_005825088.1 hypothetical protein GUITHDRAFT_115662 [Guillardia theta CCMP2712]